MGFTQTAKAQKGVAVFSGYGNKKPRRGGAEKVRLKDGYSGLEVATWSVVPTGSWLL